MIRSILVLGILALTLLNGCTTMRKTMDSMIESRKPARKFQVARLNNISPGEISDGRIDDISGTR